MTEQNRASVEEVVNGNGAGAGLPQAQGSAPAPVEEARGQRVSVTGEEALAVARSHRQVKEVVDELAHDTARATALHAVEAQLRDKQHVTRLVFVCQVTDDKRVHAQVERDFQTWLSENDPEMELTGFSVLLAASPASAIMSFFEGPTEKLFGAFKFFNDSSVDRGEQKPALVSNLRMVYFTEMHKVRLTPAWAMFSHATKAAGGQAQQEINLKSTIFLMYKKLLMLGSKVKSVTKDEAGSGENGVNAVKNVLKNTIDMLPTIDEALLMLGKTGQEFLFSYAEFEKTFVAPFHMVLQSELLWPMPPSLSY